MDASSSQGWGIKMEMAIEEYENLRPAIWMDIQNKKLGYHVPNKTAVWRVETLLTKEPATIDWLNRLDSSSILLDVGANVGMYSIYAAALKGSKVFAFEPESQNFSILVKNIFLNNVQKLVTPFCVSITDSIRLDLLHLSDFTWDGGGSCHSFGDEVGFDLNFRKSPFSQGSSSYTIDKAIEEGVVEVPTHIKIDVDGFEHKVIYGALNTLENDKLKSLCIEINPNLDEHLELVNELRSLNFFFDPQQVSKVMRKEGPFIGCAEFIFDRMEKIAISFSSVKSKLNAPNFLSNEHELAQKHAEFKISNTEIITAPFPYLVIDEVFPIEYYSKMTALFPSIDSAISLGETGRVSFGAYKERKVSLFENEYFDKFTKEQLEFWPSFAKWFYSESFICSALDKFKPWCVNRLSQIEAKHGDIKLGCDALFVHDQNHYAIGPHTDAKHRLLTFLYYMPSDESMKDLGTYLYQCIDPDFYCPGGPHYDFKNFQEVKRIDFLPNRLLSFVRTGKSFHGVPEIVHENVDRKLIINNIRLFDES